MLKKNIYIFLIVTAVVSLTVFMLSGQTRTHQQTTKNTPDVPPEISLLSPEQMPEVDWVDMSGRNFQAAAPAGGYLLLNFWATWCAPCVVEFPEIIRFAEAHEDISLVLISGDQDAEDIHDFTTAQPQDIQDALLKNPRLHMVHDATGDITRNIFQTFKLPETYIINDKGQITAKIGGPLTAAGYEYISGMK